MDTDFHHRLLLLLQISQQIPISNITEVGKLLSYLVPVLLCILLPHKEEGALLIADKGIDLIHMIL